VIVYYSGRTTPIQTDSAEVLGGEFVMLSYDVIEHYPDQERRLERIVEERESDNLLRWSSQE